MTSEPHHLLAAIPADLTAEQVLPLLSADGVRIERIVSNGQASPPDFWYEQDEHEWVLVLQGRGLLEYLDGRTVELPAGTALFIPSETRHRVRETSRSEPTVWLAVFWRPKTRENP